MIRPVGDQVLVLLETDEEQKKGSLFVIGEKNYLEGTVQAVSAGVVYSTGEVDFKPGDRVILKLRPRPGEEYVRVMDEGDIFILADAICVLGVLTQEKDNG